MPKQIILDECSDRSQGSIKGLPVSEHDIFSEGKAKCPYCIHKCIVKVGKL